MTISSKDLSLISNFTESKRKSSPQVMISFIEMVENSEEVNLQRKRKDRELAIDAIVDDKIEEFNKRKTYLENKIEGLSGIPTITPKINQMLVSTVNFITDDEIYFAIMSRLEQLTSVPMSGNNMDIKEETENINQFCRKVVTNIMYCNNKIAIESRLGPGNTIIVGSKAYQYLLRSSILLQCEEGICKSKMFGINIIPTNLISDNKIITMRVSSKFENGINCGSFPNDGIFFLKETLEFEKCIKWFSII